MPVLGNSAEMKPINYYQSIQPYTTFTNSDLCAVTNTASRIYTKTFIIFKEILHLVLRIPVLLIMFSVIKAVLHPFHPCHYT